MFPNHSSAAHQSHTSKTTKIKEAAKTATDRVKTQAEQIYQAYSVKN